MAEKDNTTASAPVQPAQAPTPAPEQAPVTQEAAPKSAGNGGGEKPAVTVNQGKSARLLEINEKLNSGVLSVDERAELEEKKKELEKEGEADGETNELKDDDVKKDDPKDNKFTEQDIIKYMYNEWLIALGCWCGKKIEKAVGTGFYQMERRAIQRHAELKAEKEGKKKSNSYQNYKKLGALKDRTAEEIKKRDYDRSQTVQNLAQAIGDGKMTSESVTDLLALAKYMGVKPETVQDNPEISKIVEASAKHKAIKDSWYQSLGITAHDVEDNKKLPQTEMKKLEKENPEQYKEALAKQKELIASQKELCELGARFALRETRKIAYDSMTDQAAIALAEAKMLDTIANTKNGNPFPDLTDEFKKQSAQYRNDLNEMTADERQRFIEGNNKKQIYTSGGTYVEINTMDRIERINGMAHRASSSAGRNFKKFRVAEFGEKPKRNRPLTKMEKNITDFKDKNKAPTEEVLKQQEDELEAGDEKEKQEDAQQEKKEAQQEEKDAKKAPSKDLKEQAVENQQKEKEIKEQQASFTERSNGAKDRENAHEEKGKSLLSRTQKIKSQIKKTKQQIGTFADKTWQQVKRPFMGKGHEI